MISTESFVDCTGLELETVCIDLQHGSGVGVRQAPGEHHGGAQLFFFFDAGRCVLWHPFRHRVLVRRPAGVEMLCAVGGYAE